MSLRRRGACYKNCYPTRFCGYRALQISTGSPRFSRKISQGKGATGQRKWLSDADIYCTEKAATGQSRQTAAINRIETIWQFLDTRAEEKCSDSIIRDCERSGAPRRPATCCTPPAASRDWFVATICAPFAKHHYHFANMHLINCSPSDFIWEARRERAWPCPQNKLARVVVHSVNA